MDAGNSARVALRGAVGGVAVPVGGWQALGNPPFRMLVARGVWIANWGHGGRKTGFGNVEWKLGYGIDKNKVPKPGFFGSNVLRRLPAKASRARSSRSATASRMRPAASSESEKPSAFASSSTILKRGGSRTAWMRGLLVLMFKV